MPAPQSEDPSVVAFYRLAKWLVAGWAFYALLTWPIRTGSGTPVWPNAWGCLVGSTAFGVFMWLRHFRYGLDLRSAGFQQCLVCMLGFLSIGVMTASFAFDGQYRFQDLTVGWGTAVVGFFFLGLAIGVIWSSAESVIRQSIQR